MIYGVYDKKSNNGPEPDEVMAESFSASYGLAQAMLESAYSDYAMFEAMMKVDAMEIKINEKYLNEAETEEGEAKAEESKEELNNGAKDSIWKKIWGLITAAAEKIAAAVFAVCRKLHTIVANDKKLIAKYGDRLKAKASELDDLEIKWYNINKSAIDDVNKKTEQNSWYTNFKPEAAKANFKEKNTDRRAFYNPIEMNRFLDDTKTTKKLGEVGGISKVIERIEFAETSINMYSKWMAVECKKVKETAKSYKPDRKAEDAESAAKVYKMAQAWRDVSLQNIRTANAALIKEYKMYKAAFTKAVASGLAKVEASIVEHMVLESEFEIDDIMDAPISYGVTEAVVYDKFDSYSEEAEYLDSLAVPVF